MAAATSSRLRQIEHFGRDRRRVGRLCWDGWRLLGGGALGIAGSAPPRKQRMLPAIAATIKAAIKILFIGSPRNRPPQTSRTGRQPLQSFRCRSTLRTLSVGYSCPMPAILEREQLFAGAAKCARIRCDDSYHVRLNRPLRPLMAPTASRTAARRLGTNQAGTNPRRIR